VPPKALAASRLLCCARSEARSPEDGKLSLLTASTESTRVCPAATRRLLPECREWGPLDRWRNEEQGAETRTLTPVRGDPTRSGQTEWPGLHLDSVKAVVLDTNAFGKSATFDMGLLRRLGRDANDRDIEVWLPEPVLWELAAHISDVVDDLTADVRARNRLLERAGLETVPMPTYRVREALIQQIIESAAEAIEGLYVIECSADALKEALRDQITGRPPAGTDQGVKTGAADSAWIRAVREEAADPSNRSYVIVSDDKAVAQAFKSWGEDPPAIFPSIDKVREHVLGFQLASHQIAMRAAKLVQNLIAGGDLAQLVGSETLDLRVLLRNPDLAQGRDVIEATGDVAEFKTLVGVDVRAQESEQRILTWMDVLTDVNLSFKTLDPITEELAQEQSSVPDVIVRVPLLIDLTNKSMPSVEPARAPWVLFSESCWEDQDEAASACFVSLWQVPEFEGSTLSDPGPGRPWTAQLSDGRTLHIQYSDEPHGGWRMRARVGRDEVTLVCRRPVMVVDCEWVVDVEGSSILRRHPTFAFGELVIRKRLESV
jgi:hypothetical protein